MPQIICYFATVMKRPFYISLLLCCIVGFAACTGPVILEEDEASNSVTGQDTPHRRDSVPIIHEGTYESPYSIGEVQTLGRGKEVWIEGYIVGCVSGSMKNGCDFTPKATTLSNILLADTFPTGKDYDYLYCLPVELPTNSIERDDLNLYDNPDNYHRKIRLQGDITFYYKVVGMKEVEDYIFEDEVIPEKPSEDDSENEEETSDPENPDTPHDPDATRQDTLTIAEGIKLQSETEYNQVYIKGYIIGYTTSNRKLYCDTAGIKATAKTNVVLADNLTEQNPDRVIAVELENGSYIQQVVSLYYKPENFHRSLIVKGRMAPYRSLNGCIAIPKGKEEPIGSGIIIEDYYFSIE